MPALKNKNNVELFCNNLVAYCYQFSENNICTLITMYFVLTNIYMIISHKIALKDDKQNIYLRYGYGTIKPGTYVRSYTLLKYCNSSLFIFKEQRKCVNTCSLTKQRLACMPLLQSSTDIEIVIMSLL